jgi:hypothetical protein
MCSALFLVLRWIPLTPDDNLQPSEHGIQYVLHDVSTQLVCTVSVMASSIEVAASWDFSCLCGLSLC